MDGKTVTVYSRRSVVDSLLVIAGGVLGMAALGLTLRAIDRPPRTQDRAGIERVLAAAFINEHVNPSAMGPCWFPNSPAQAYIQEQLPELQRLSHHAGHYYREMKPKVEYVNFYDGGYAEAGTTELWYLSTTDAKPTPKALSRTYFLKQNSGAWQVYRVTPLPLPDAS